MTEAIPVNLATSAYPRLAGSAKNTLLAIPLGATEQHGPHLPLHTDTVIATELCTRLAANVPGVHVAPAVPYGSSGEHAGFPGTLSIGQEALRHLLVELVRSADDFAGAVLVSGHGGNLRPLHSAARLLRDERRHALPWFPCGPGDDSHAGHTETSVMLALRSAEVDLDAAEPGNTEALSNLIEQLQDSGTAVVSPNGVLGDPTHANAADGERMLRRWTDALVARVSEWRGAT